MTVTTTDCRDSTSVNLVFSNTEVICFYPQRGEFRFSHGAWKYFARYFVELLQIETRYQPGVHHIYAGGERRKLCLEDPYYGRKLSVYPGAYEGEWKVEFSENTETHKATLELSLRDATGKGSTDYAEQINEMLTAT